MTGCQDRDLLCGLHWVSEVSHQHRLGLRCRLVHVNPESNEIQGSTRRFYFFQRTSSNSQWTPTGSALDYSLVFLYKVFKERKFSWKLLIFCGIKKFNKRKKNTITVAFAAAAKSCVGWKERSINFENRKLKPRRCLVYSSRD